MGSASASGKLILSALFFVAFMFSFGTSPVHAAAQTISPDPVRTQQVLPPGQNTCQQVSITNIEPHIYGGVLESFDVTISDTGNSYVGILAQVGDTPIPLDFITRWAGVPSGLRIHVDTPDTPIYGTLPVNLVLLSSPHGAPTCITAISFSIGSAGIAPSAPSPIMPSPSSSVPPVQGSTKQEITPEKTAPHIPASAQVGTSTPAVGATIAASNNAKLFNAMCGGTNSYRLWFILLFIYLVIVAVVIFAEPWFLESSVVGSTAAILVPLILLLAFWYLSESCRAASWIPVVACVIAIIGLFLAFREYELPPLLPAPTEQ